MMVEAELRDFFPGALRFSKNDYKRVPADTRPPSISVYYPCYNAQTTRGLGNLTRGREKTAEVSFNHHLQNLLGRKFYFREILSIIFTIYRLL